LALPHRHRKTVVAAMHEPGKRARDGDATGLKHTVTDAETSHGAEVLVEVLAGLITAQVADKVLGEELALTHSVLRVGHTHAGNPAATQVWNGADIASTPHV